MEKAKGFGIIEVIITLSIISVFVMTIGSALSMIYRLYNAGAMKTQALIYAQEPLEIISGLQNNLFSDIYDGPTRFYLDNNDWQFKALPSGITKKTIGISDFSREIIIENLARTQGNIDLSGTDFDSNNTKKVTVIVYWQERGMEKNVSLSTVFTNWRNL